MDKFKSYVGLVVVAAVAWLFLWPQPVPILQDTVRSTALDRTGISQIVQFRSPSFRLLAHAQAYSGRCANGPDTPEPQPYPGCGLYLLAPSEFDVYDVSMDIYRYDHEFFKALNAYDQEPPGGAKQEAWAKVEARAIATYPRLLREYELTYTVAVYVLHVFFFGLLVLGFIYRRSLGGAVLWPLTGVAALAKRAHDKV